MAKIKANGCIEITRATKVEDYRADIAEGIIDSGFVEVKHTLVLRSDGKVLQKVDCKHGEAGWPERWSFGSYKIIGTCTATDEESAADRFGRYALARGYSFAV